jgi:DNA-binding transcriptional LysR family regulator
MEIQHLKEFAVLAETQNYLEASELLFISQSTLSKHIKALEEELGAQVFDRTTRRVQLNDTGKTLLEYAKQMVALDYQCAARIRASTTTRRHALRIGSLPIMAPYGITKAIAAFKRQNPEFTVTVIEGDSAALKQALLQDRLDLAFIRANGGEEPEFTRIPFATDSLAAVLPVNHPLVGNKTVRLERLADEDFMLLLPGSVVHDQAVTACRNAGFEPRVVFTCSRAENIIDLVGQGMGVGLLQRKSAKRLVSGPVVVIEVRPLITTEVKIHYRADVPLSATAQDFIDSVTLLRAIGA